MKRIKLKSALRWFAVLTTAAALYGAFWWMRTRWIPAGYVGVIYDASGGLQKTVYRPQAVTVGWRQQLYTYPTKLQAAIYTQDPDSGEERAADGILVTTNDNASTTFDVAVFYHVAPEDVFKAFDAFGPIPIEDIQSLHIRRAVKEAANAVGTRYDLFELMGPKREIAGQQLMEELRGRLGGKGISIDSAMFGSCYPSAEIQAKITSRVNSYIELEISRLKRQIAEIERQIAVVQGEAEMKARQLTASQTQDKSIEMLKLDAMKDAIDRWDGELPAINPKPGQTIIVGSDAIKSVTGGTR